MSVSLPQSSQSPSRQHIFVSYAGTDRAQVEPIYQRLNYAGLPMWIDNLDVKEGLRGGEPWREGLADALQAAMAVVWMVSPASVSSDWVQAELRRALELGKPLIPYELDAGFEQLPAWQDVVSQFTNNRRQKLNDLQRIVPARLGDDLAVDKVISQLRQHTQSTRISGSFPTSQLDIPLTGRDADRDRVLESLRRENRLVVVMAVGGTGKTRLAAEIAMRSGQFRDGVVWQTLDRNNREEDLTLLLREHMGLPQEATPDEVWAALARFQILIVLDNAETCPERAPYIQRLEHYPLSGGSRVLMTSREQWRETRRINTVHDLAALDLDCATQLTQLMAKQQNVSVQLAGREQEFAQTGRCHPRLIQYALGWLHDYALERILTMLTSLKGGDDVAEALEDIVHRTIRQIEAQPNGSWAIADLKKLLVCEGGFTDAAAEALLGSVDSLSTLRRWNLLQLEGGRYTPEALVKAALEPDTRAG